MCSYVSGCLEYVFIIPSDYQSFFFLQSQGNIIQLDCPLGVSNLTSKKNVSLYNMLCSHDWVICLILQVKEWYKIGEARRNKMKKLNMKVVVSIFSEINDLYLFFSIKCD